MLLADHLPDPHEQVFEHRPLAGGEVEHDQVIVFFRAGPQSKLARFRVIHGVARLSQRSYEPVRQRIIVFDDQNSHNKWLNWFEVQDSTRTGSGFSSGAHGHSGKKVRGSASRAPTPQRRKETTRETVRGSGLQ